MTEPGDKVKTLGPSGERVRQAIKRLRGGLQYKDLSAWLRSTGRPIPVLGLSRLERGERRADADDLIGLALAFGVTPNTLLLPAGDEDGTHLLTPEVSGSAIQLWEWAQGERPITPPADPGRFSDLEFAKRNRSYLMAIRNPLPGEPAPGMRDIALAVATALRAGVSPADVRRLVELVILYPLSGEDVDGLIRKRRG